MITSPQHDAVTRAVRFEHRRRRLDEDRLGIRSVRPAPPISRWKSSSLRAFAGLSSRLRHRWRADEVGAKLMLLTSLHRSPSTFRPNGIVHAHIKAAAPSDAVEDGLPTSYHGSFLSSSSRSLQPRLASSSLSPGQSARRSNGGKTRASARDVPPAARSISSSDLHVQIPFLEGDACGGKPGRAGAPWLTLSGGRASSSANMNPDSCNGAEPEMKMGVGGLVNGGDSAWLPGHSGLDRRLGQRRRSAGPISLQKGSALAREALEVV